MNCRGVIHELSSFLDGEMDAAMKRDLERHLSECTECRLLIVQTKKTIEVFCGDEPIELPREVRSRLHDALKKKLGGAPC
ncbi:MAG TPA: anti-sigma factor [Candidatus Acidoferrum sp.]|nr:anti-sigma factor [Candidatus Acidoferrum sp.]